MSTTSDAITQAVEPTIFALHNGPVWRSFDRFKNQGARELERQLPEGQVGHLNAKDVEFVIMRAETWNQVYGLAHDVSRFRQGMRLVREAVKLFLHVEGNPEGSKVAIDLLRDLTYQLPDLPTEVAPPRGLTFSEEERAEVSDDDVDFELRPMPSAHPSFAHER